MKTKISVIFLLSFFICGCIFSTEENGHAKFILTPAKISNVLSKVSSADTIFRIDTLVISLSSPGEIDVIQKYPISGRADSSNVAISPKIISNLAPLRNWKAKFYVIDTTLSPVRKDTTHIDSITFFLKPGDTSIVTKTLSPRFSILRIRLYSTSGTFVSNNVRNVRIRVNGITADSVLINSKIFDQVLTYKYLEIGRSFTVIAQAFDNITYDRGYEKTFTIFPSSSNDTTIIDSISVRSANAQNGGSSSTIKLDASASSVTNFYSGMTVVIISGNGIGQSRTITNYNRSTKVATITPNWLTTPNSTSVFLIYHRNLLTICGRTGFPACTI